MKSINITKEGIIEYYGNKAGYVRDTTAYVDEMFKKADIQDYLGKENGFSVEWQKGLYDRLVKGEFSHPQESEAKKCRLYQLKNTTNVEMRYIKYSDLKAKGFGEPNMDDYKVIYDGYIGTTDLEEIYERFDKKNVPGEFNESGIYISDVIELYDESSREFYYINPTGFERLEHFDEPRIKAEKRFEKESTVTEEKTFDRTVTAKEPIEIPKPETPEPEPELKPENTEMPTEKQTEFQVETFKITM